MNAEFIKYQAQTTTHPLGLEISHAKGSYIYSTHGKEYLDFVAGVSACSLGHCHPKVVTAVKEQVDKYFHVMVYGEYAQAPAVQFTKLFASQLPNPLEKTYLVNSGTEAVEGAMKLARRFTGRSEIIAAKNAYHGNTFGSLSLMDAKERQAPFQPLVGDISHITFNSALDLKKITSKTAAVILETIQGGAGFIFPEEGYLRKVKQACETLGALLILDEIQPGFGRTGKLFGFQHFDVIPDILVVGKGMGGGLPIGGFTASTKIMDSLTHDPELGHITTFGGNPVIAAAALATLKEITETDLMSAAIKKEKLFRKLLVHPLIQEVRGKGLMLAIMTPTKELASEIILKCQEKGLILFWLLFEKKAVRITPPLTISEAEIEEGCGIIIDVLNEIYSAN